MQGKTKNNNEKLPCYLLLFLLILYHSQGVFSGIDLIGPVILIIILGISFFYLLKMLNSRYGLSHLQKVWLFFIILTTTYFVFYNNYTLEYNYGIARQTLLNFLPFFPFYYFASKGILTRNMLLIFLLVMGPILMIDYTQSLASLRLERDKDNVVDNSIYALVGLLPFTLLFRKKILSFLAIVILGYFMIQSAKRAAIIAGAITFLVFSIEFLFTSKSKYKIVSLLGFTLFLVVGLYAGMYFYEQNEFAVERMTQMTRVVNEGEARNFLIEMTLNGWLNTDSFFRYIFGVGFDATRYLTHNFHISHNDWMEILSGYGLLGLVVFSSIFYLLVKKVFSEEGIRDKRMCLILFILLALLISGTSRWYWSSFAYMNCLFLPYILATYKEEI